MLVLDTNILIYFFKGMGNVAQKMLATPPKDIAVPAIVLYELNVGIQKSSSPRKRKTQLNQLIDIVTTLPFGSKEAEVAAAIRTKLEKKGLLVGPYDILIAATALAGNHTLVTHNVKEFKRIPGLKVEDWY